MAIIIPSKNIYEIDNQKVVDNEVDNIEMQTVNPFLKNDYGVVVYDNDYDVSENITTKNYKETKKADNYKLGTSTLDMTYIRLAATSELQLKYKTIPQIKIPKIQNSILINKLLYQTDSNGDEQIRYSLSADLKKYTWNGIGYSPKDNAFNFYDNLVEDWESKLMSSTRASTYKTIGTDYSATETLIDEFPTLTAEQSCTISDNEIKTRSYIHGFDTTWNSSYPNGADAVINQIAEEHLVLDYDTDIEETGEYFILKNIKILIGLENKLGYAYLTSNTPVENLGELGGTYIRGRKLILTPLSVSLSVYGDTLVLDLQDETIKIGSGQHVYSFDGNELMQTTNQKTVEETYSEIINEWGYGKEIATLKCAIAEYYGGSEENITVNVTQVFDVSGTYKEVIIDFTSTKAIFIQGSCQIYVNGEYYSCYSLREQSNLKYQCSIRGLSGSDISTGSYQMLCMASGVLINPKESGYPMTFHIGDVVIPYILSPQGQEKPMSFYSDKTTPKKFMVIQSGIIADGEIMQQIVIQEVPNSK